MSKIQINAYEFVKDVRAGKSDTEIMEKFGLSVRSLPRVKQELVKRGLLSREEAGSLDSTFVSPKITINAKEFLELFRSSPDDFVLMETYSIATKQLRLIYQTLIKKGLLSDYEYEHRQGKAPELEEMSAPARDDSTSVTLKELILGDLQDYLETAPSDPEPGPSGGPISDPPSGMAFDLGKAVQDFPSRDPDLETCPNCKQPKQRSSPNECLRCGMVYAKYYQHLGRRGVPIWPEDYPTR